MRFSMGLRLHHVSSVVLVCVVLLLRDNLVVDAAQASEPFVDFRNIPPERNWTYELPSLTARQSQRCLYPEKIRFKENATGPVFSFSTKFVAHIKRRFGYRGAARNIVEGFTFAMLPHPNASLGGDGGYLGLLNGTSNGDPKSHTFAVEFDFVQSPQFSDPDEGFHIGIDINSMNSSSWVSLEGPSTDYWKLQVWIDYDASSQFLSVSTADISARNCPFTDKERLVVFKKSTGILHNSLSVQVDLSNVLNEHMYAGFTSSVVVPQLGDPDAAPDFQEIGPWSLRTSTWPAAPSAPLYCDPLIASIQSNSFPFELWEILGSLTAIATICTLLYKWYSQRVERRGWRFKIDPDDLGDVDPHKFTYKELAMATKNFDSKQALGQGGFGSVYKGFLPGNKQYVAVKRVASDSNQGEHEFLTEVVIIDKIRHRNLVRLQGWCHERDELLLVYDYMPEGSLDKYLFGSPFSTLVDLQVVGDQQRDKLVAVDEELVIRFRWERRW